jgi:phage tail sheath protein FI
MPSYTYPGVYIQELAGGPVPVQSASPSTAALVGGALEGPVNTPTLVTSFTEYVRKFGSFNSLSLMTTSAFAFFQNGGQRLRVVRVAPADAVAASAALSEDITGESLTADAGTLTPTFAAFTGANGTARTPVKAGTLNIVCAVGAVGTLLDDGSGGLSGIAGVTGTIDYETGEITVSSTGPDLSVTTFAAAYSYLTFSFEVTFPGASGNGYTLVVEGDPNYEDVTTASFTRYILSILDSDNATLESYDAVSFTDPTSDSFITSVLNDASTGSSYISVTAEGNNVAPSGLSGASVSGESLTPSPAYDGTTRAFTYTLASGVSPFSLTSSFEFQHTDAGDAAMSGNGTIPAGAPFTTFSFNIPVSTLSLVNQDIAAGRVTADAVRQAMDGAVLVLSATPDSGGGTPAADETFTYSQATDSFASSGAVLNNDSISASSISVAGGTVTASITLAPVTNPDPQFDGGAAPALPLSGGSSYPAFTYSLGIVPLEEDGEGAVSVASGGTAVGITLDASATNSITYGSSTAAGSLSLTWRFSDNPARGPLSAASQTANYYSVAPSDSVSGSMTGGADGSALSRSVVSAPALASSKAGIYSLNTVEEILNICIPDFEADPTVSGDLIDYCETRKDRFCVVSVPQGLDNSQAVNYKKVTLNKNSSRAAIYYPHVRILDPLTENEVLHPAGGHILGIYARTDENANVSTAPAGTQRGEIAFCTGLEFEMTPAQAGVTNQAHVNNLVNFPYTGRVVWGARTLQVGGEFPYIQMRRLFIFLEKSVFNSTQRFVFENNGAALQAQVRLAVESFLLNLYNEGLFSGNTPDQAFFVVCDSSNNPADKVAQGILTCDVGVAPTRPAEFIVFRFQQKALEG